MILPRLSRAAAAPAALALLALATPSAAQMFSGLPQQLSMQRVMNIPAQSAVRRAASGRAAAAPAAKPFAFAAPRATGGLTIDPPTGGGATAVTTYTASPAVTAEVETRFVDFVRSRDPAQGAQMESLLAKVDLETEWAKVTREDGFRAGDTAEAFAAYWLLNWLIANQRNGNTPAEAAAVRRQVRGYFASDPSFAQLTPAQRQEMAEVLMLNFLVQHGAYMAAARDKDRGMLARLSEAARQRFQAEMGVDLRDLRLTDAGFVPA